MSDLLSLPDGVHPNVSDKIYHQRHLGVVSKSVCDLIDRSPAHYKAWVDGVAEDDSTPALELGRAFHCALLEPDRFLETYTAEPDFGDCRKADNKKRRDEWRAEHAGFEMLSEEAFRSVEGMAASARKHPLAKQMIQNGKSELTLKWTDQETGLTCKSRLDYYVESHAMILDAKSCLDARESKFKRDIVNYRYFVQDALYRSAALELFLPVKHFVFIAIEKSPPFAVATYTLDAEGIAKGYGAARANINMLAFCKKTETWPGYPVEIRELSLPPWAA
jgi:hypothetical protein